MGSGLNSVRIRHRLSINLSEKENRFTHQMNFCDKLKIIYKQESQIASIPLELNVKDFKIGKYHFFGKEKKKWPFRF